MTKQTRTDAHRPSAIIPANYEDWCSYSLERGTFIRPIGLDCAMPYFDEVAKQTVRPTCPDTGRCCVASTERHARREGREIFGRAGKCGVCGAHFAYGTTFRHEPDGAIVHVGHDCADKYAMMYDLSAWELENGRVRAAAAKQIQRAENDRERAAFLAAHEGLAEDLALGDDDVSAKRGARILADIARKFVTYRSLSEKQVAFVRKLAGEIRNPPPPALEERKAVAPEGKGVEFTGEIVSCKLRESEQWGVQYKITVKVTNEDGSVWLAWGNAPRNLLDLAVECAEAQDAAQRAAWVEEQKAALATNPDHNPGSYPRPRLDRATMIASALKGLRVEVKSTLERPQPRDLSEYETDGARRQAEQRNADRNFAFMSRPTIYPATMNPAPRPVKRPTKAAVIKAFGHLLAGA